MTILRKDTVLACEKAINDFINPQTLNLNNLRLRVGPALRHIAVKLAEDANMECVVDPAITGIHELFNEDPETGIKTSLGFHDISEHWFVETKPTPDPTEEQMNEYRKILADYNAKVNGEK